MIPSRKIAKQDSSSAADDSIAKESQDSSSAADDSIAKESQDISSSACGNNTEALPAMKKSNQSLPVKPVSSMKPNVDWADESPDTSDEDVNMSYVGVGDSSLDHAEINPGFSAGSSVNAIVHESSPSAEGTVLCPKDLASAFKGFEAGKTRWTKFVHSQSKENSPSPSPSRVRDSKSPVEYIDPKGAQADLRFALPADAEEAIDLSQEEEVMPETLLHGHFKVLYDQGKLNTVEEVKAVIQLQMVLRHFLDINLKLSQVIDHEFLSTHKIFGGSAERVCTLI
jgi:hypothetical protein